ncbi:MAG: DUF4157 domain-containing protein, partial [Acidobacteriota bacterium]|nr:DUF4157 domain-containing protein [Acidobacteriota bacterium]
MSTPLQTQSKAKPATPVGPTHSRLLQRQCACGGKPGVMGECSECREKQLTLKRSPVGRAKTMASVPPAVHDTLNSPGQPLPPAVRSFIEPRFGHSFQNVRIHTDERAAASAHAVKAKAYTVGSDVVFGAGQYAPETKEGQRLLAHELTHVIQQGGSTPIIARQANEEEEPAAAPASGQSSASAKLLSLINTIEELHARAGQRLESDAAGGAASDGQSLQAVQQDLYMVAGGLAQLREIANGSDENLKLSVLAAFTPRKLEEADAQLTETPEVAVSEQRPEGVAAMSLQVSNPTDAAEVEADRVSDAIVSGGSAPVTAATQTGVMNRFVDEKLIALAEALTAAEVGGGAEV